MTEAAPAPSPSPGPGVSAGLYRLRSRRRGAGLGAAGGSGHIAAMPRPIIALLAGLLGFTLYVGAAVALADVVLHLHWLVQLLYFTVAGIAWAWPARALMFWAVRSRG